MEDEYKIHIDRWSKSNKPKEVVIPKIGQESVWNYPRPPRIEPISDILIIENNQVEIVNSQNALKVMETASPPTYYIPTADIKIEYFQKNSKSSYCEWKGKASYYDFLSDGTIIQSVGWYYNKPKSKYASLKDHVAFYASKFDQCTVGEMKVTSQKGDFYGGWITDNIVGPFKGDPGTLGW